MSRGPNKITTTPPEGYPAVTVEVANRELVAMEVARLATVIESLTERIRSLEDDNVRLKHHLRWNEDAN